LIRVRVPSRIGALPNRNVRPDAKLPLILEVADFLGGEENVWTTIIFLLIAWLGLNMAFVAWRFYATAHHDLRIEPDVVGYPTLLNN
jgi:hypothetical protein